MRLVLLALLALPAQAESPLSMSLMHEGALALRVCTGKIGNNYHRVGQKLAARLGQKLSVRVIPTRGSWQNLELTRGNLPECDAVIAQADAVDLFQHRVGRVDLEPIAALYPEHMHLVCNRKDKVDSAPEMDGRFTVFSGGQGSGSRITWRQLRRFDKRFRAAKPKASSRPSSSRQVAWSCTVSTPLGRLPSSAQPLMRSAARWPA